MAAAALPQVPGASPKAVTCNRNINGSVPKLPSICTSTSSDDEELGEGEHAAFVANFGYLAGEKAPSQNFQAHLASLLGTFQFFQDLDPFVVAKLPAVITGLSKRTSTVLFRQGDPPGNCYIILSGEASICVKSEEELAEDALNPKSGNGMRTVEGFSTYNEDTKFGTQIGVLGPGTLLGELALLNDQPRSASVRCDMDTDFLVVRRADFDNILKEDMVSKGDEKLKFLMAHVPGMRDGPMPKLGTKQPHASYYFKKANFPRGHSFFREGSVAEPSIIVMYKGSAECRRSELAPCGAGSALPSSASTPALEARSHEDPLPGGCKLGNFRRSPSMISRSNYNARLKSLAREKELGETINRLGVLMPGGVFGSLPLQEKEPYSVFVTSAQCEVFICSGSDLSKLPRRLLETVRDYLATTAAWRLGRHLQSQDFRKSRPLEVGDKLAKKRQPLIRIKSSPVL